MPWTPDEVNEKLARRLESVSHTAVDSLERLTDAYGINPQDARVAVTWHIRHVAGVILLQTLLLSEGPMHGQWWRDHYREPVPENDVRSLLKSYEVMLALDFVVHPFSQFESGIRRVVRALEPDACSGGSARFSSVWAWLLARLHKSGWTYAPGEEKEFIKLYGLVRNTIHNDSFFYPLTRTSTTVTWRGERYEFIYGSEVPFLNWDFHFTIVSELLTLTEVVMLADLIKELDGVP